MSDFKFLMDFDRTSVLELKLGTYMKGDRGLQGIQGEDGPAGTLTPEDQATLQGAVNASAASATAALNSQTAAAGSANAAASSATQAASSVTASGANATQAAQSAGAAGQSATDAAAAQGNVAASANAAAASASAAHISETNSAASAGAAAGSQGAAGSSATAAAGSASAAAASAAAAASVQLRPFRNLFHNARFQVNQRFIASGSAAASGYAMSLDRWRIVVSGQTASWAQQANGTYSQVVCPAGGFEQVVDGLDIVGGQYVINWLGTATCQMGTVAAPTTVVKGQVLTLAAGAAVQFRFSNGTLAQPQLEPGTVPTSFELVPYAIELTRCSSYFRVVLIDRQSYQVGGQSAIWSIHFPPMRSVPVNAGLVRGSVPSYFNINTPPTFWIGLDNITCTVVATASNPWFAVGYQLGLSADL
jgi:hypothetical protein